MIGRDKITISYTKDSVPVVRTIYGHVTTESLDAKLEPFGNTLVFQSFYRLYFPRSLALTGASNIRVSFHNRANTPLVTGIIPVYDGRGRIHHYEGVVRSS